MKIPTPNEKDFEITPSGTFAARCYRFIDLGTQPKEYQGTTSYKRMVMISWELPTELMADGRPFSIHKRYVWSMSEKSRLRQDLESWRGIKFTDADFGVFDTKKLLGVTCTLGVTHTIKGDKTYSNISSISRIMKGVEVPPQVNESVYFSLEESNPDPVSFDKLSQKIKDTIMRSPEYVELTKPARFDTLEPEVFPDIPF